MPRTPKSCLGLEGKAGERESLGLIHKHKEAIITNTSSSHKMVSIFKMLYSPDFAGCLTEFYNPLHLYSTVTHLPFCEMTDI